MPAATVNLSFDDVILLRGLLTYELLHYRSKSDTRNHRDKLDAAEKRLRTQMGV